MKLNVMLMGITVACTLAVASPALAHHGVHGDMHHGMGEECCDKTLPPDKAKMVEGAMHSVMEKNERLMERMHKLHEKLRAIGTADKFDKKAFLATGDEMAALHMKMEKNRTAMMASVAEKLSGSERRAMAKCMEGRFHHGEEEHEGRGEGSHEHHFRMNDNHNDYNTLNQ